MADAVDLNIVETEPSLTRNLLLVYGVSFLDLSLSFLTNLLIPIVADKTDFANYRKLVLYANYAGFMHCGLLSGMYIYVVGKSKAELDWNLLVGIRRVLFALQLILLPMVWVALWAVTPQGPGKLVISLTAVCWGLANVATFHNYLFLGTNRFGSFFRVNVAVKLLSIMLVCYIALSKTATANRLMLIFVVPLLVTVLVYEFVWKNLPKGVAGFRGVWNTSELAGLWRRGLILYGANVCIALLFSIDNLTVSVLFSSSEFANYAFAYGLTTVLYFAIDGLTVAVTPYVARAMRSVNTEDMSDQLYLTAIWIVPIWFWLSAALVNRFFPQYLESRPLLFCFSLALPFNILVRSRVVSIATASGLEKFLFKFAIAGFSLTSASVAVAYFLLHSIYGVALGWAAAMVITGVVGLLAVHRLSGNVSQSGFQLVGNALGATTLYILCAALGGAGRRFAIVYLFGACTVLVFNWLRRRST